MKICPVCQTPNEDDAKFCENCGYRFTEADDQAAEKATHGSTSDLAENSTTDPTTETISPVREGYRRDQQGHQSKSKVPWIITGVILAAILLTVIVYFAFFRPDSQTTSPTSDFSTTATSSVDTSKYDEIIKEAKELTIAGKFTDSELKLATIPVSELAKPEFAAVQQAVEELTSENNAGIQADKAQQAQKTADKDKADADKAEKNGNNGFTGDLAKWANTYTFYYSQAGQKQSSLTISANGGVTQNNNDGTQYFGTATITESGGDVLSYATNELYPMEMPATKTITPNVKISVKWDNGGGSQTYYGYLSYSSRLALTDGQSKNDGVNEVWISY